MNSRNSLFVELIVIGVLLFIVESIAPLVVMLYKLPKDISLLIAKTFLPIVPALLALYLIKRWGIRLSFKINQYSLMIFILVLSATASYFIVIFPISFPISFAKDIMAGRIQIPEINHSALSITIEE